MGAIGVVAGSADGLIAAAKVRREGARGGELRALLRVLAGAEQQLAASHRSPVLTAHRGSIASLDQEAHSAAATTHQMRQRPPARWQGLQPNGGGRRVGRTATSAAATAATATPTASTASTTTAAAAALVLGAPPLLDEPRPQRVVLARASLQQPADGTARQHLVKEVLAPKVGRSATDNTAATTAASFAFLFVAVVAAALAAGVVAGVAVAIIAAVAVAVAALLLALVLSVIALLVLAVIRLGELGFQMFDRLIMRCIEPLPLDRRNVVVVVVVDVNLLVVVHRQLRSAAAQPGDIWLARSCGRSLMLMRRCHR